MDARKIKSTRALARGAGVPQTTVNRLMNGGEPGNINHLIKLADFFECSLDQLLGRRTGIEALDSILTEQLYSGWLHVRVTRAVPDSKK